MFAGLKNRIIFAGELVNDETDSRVYDSGIFYFRSYIRQHRLLNPSDSRCKALSVSSKSGFSSLFLLITFLIREMTRSIKNAAKPNHSKQAAQTKTSTNYLSRGKYIQLKGQLNKAIRELEASKAQNRSLLFTNAILEKTNDAIHASFMAISNSIIFKTQNYV